MNAAENLVVPEAAVKANFKVIWEVLSSIDVGACTEIKNNATYLSWGHAWRILMEHYPTAEFWFEKYDGQSYLVYPDKTAEVSCTVRILGCERTMFLPVMTGYKNVAKEDPTARDVADAKMRCLVKCLGLFGLGFYLYYGEDLPKKVAVLATGDDKPSGFELLQHASYAFRTVAALESWVHRIKGKKLQELDRQSLERMIDFFESYKSQAEWPESLR